MTCRPAAPQDTSSHVPPGFAHVAPSIGMSRGHLSGQSSVAFARHSRLPPLQLKSPPRNRPWMVQCGRVASVQSESEMQRSYVFPSPYMSVQTYVHVVGASHAGVPSTFASDAGTEPPSSTRAPHPHEIATTKSIR